MIGIDAAHCQMSNGITMVGVVFFCRGEISGDQCYDVGETQ